MAPIRFRRLAIPLFVGACSGSSSACRRCRLRTSIFPEWSTLGFATSVTQIALAAELTAAARYCRSGISGPFNTAWALHLWYAFAAFCTWMSATCSQRFGPPIAVRDAESRRKPTAFPNRACWSHLSFAGAAGGHRRRLFASLQTYITPTLLPSICRSCSLLHPDRRTRFDPGPMLGTIILTILPEIAAPLAVVEFLYARCCW